MLCNPPTSSIYYCDAAPEWGDRLQGCHVAATGQLPASFQHRTRAYSPSHVGIAAPAVCTSSFLPAPLPAPHSVATKHAQLCPPGRTPQTQMSASPTIPTAPGPPGVLHPLLAQSTPSQQPTALNPSPKTHSPARPRHFSLPGHSSCQLRAVPLSCQLAALAFSKSSARANLQIPHMKLPRSCPRKGYK